MHKGDKQMQIKDYITKNLSSLNWNILPQIFAENGVEMNEEIEAYLRNTPENTNWSILEQLGGNTVELPHKIYFLYDWGVEMDLAKSTLKTSEEIQDWVITHKGQDIEFYSQDYKMIPSPYHEDGFSYIWVDNYDQQLFVGEGTFYRNSHD